MWVEKNMKSRCPISLYIYDYKLQVSSYQIMLLFSQGYYTIHTSLLKSPQVSSSTLILDDDFDLGYWKIE